MSKCGLCKKLKTLGKPAKDSKAGKPAKIQVAKKLPKPKK